MDIVDSQVHLWGADTPARPWPPGRTADAQKPYPIPKEALLFQMDLAKVRRMVLVPPSWEGDRNDLALEAARSYPDRFAVMGRLTLGDPKSRDLVADWKKQPGMLGMRFTFHSEHYRHLLTDGSADWLWPAAERHGIPLMVLMPGALDLLDTIAARHPGLKLVIDHVGLDIRAKAPRCGRTYLKSARWPSTPTWLSRPRGCPRSPTRAIPSAICIRTSARSSKPSARGGRSGAPTSPACRARTASASICSPRSCPGSRARTSSG
jgi:predicted TIM-barrel fold metal-dependent hydrolase